MALAFVAFFDVFVDLWAYAFPVVCLRDGVDGSCESGMAKVGMIPFDDSFLEACGYDDFPIDGVY